MFLTSNTIANDGNDLLKRCTYAAADDLPKNTTEFIGAAFCLGFIEGAVNGIQVAIAVNVEKKEDRPFCVPEGVTNSQKAKILVKYLNENPKLLHKGRLYLTIKAFVEAYPCIEKSG